MGGRPVNADVPQAGFDGLLTDDEGDDQGVKS